MLVARGVAGLAIERCKGPSLALCNPFEELVIHPDGTNIAALMLDVATAALLDVGMERSCGLHQDFRRRGVAGYAGGCLYTVIGSMAALAFALEKGVGARQRPGTDRG